MDLSFLLSSSNDSFPYSYFILLTFTIISVGVSFARILTKGENPAIQNIVSFKFFKVILMLISKLLVQCYILSMAVKSIMYKFLSKGRIHIKYIHKVSINNFFLCSSNILHIHLMTLRVTERLRSSGTEDFAHLFSLMEPVKVM